MPHYHEEKHLTIVIPLNVIKMNGCVVEFVLAEENPFGLYHITTTKKDIESIIDMEVRVATL